MTPNSPRKIMSREFLILVLKSAIPILKLEMYTMYGGGERKIHPLFQSNISGVEIKFFHLLQTRYEKNVALFKDIESLCHTICWSKKS